MHLRITLLLVLFGGFACGKESADTPKPSWAKPAAKPAITTETGAAATNQQLTEEAAVANGTKPSGDYAALYELPIKTLDGKETTLGEFRGQVILAVNVASQCGLTPQYAQLQELQKNYAARGFTVVGFPCNQFGGQEPGSPEEIQTFCSTTYGVTFPMMEKVDVNGDGRHPIYQQLTQIADASGEAGDIQWNFEKFVISADRKTVTRFRPRTVPNAPEVIAAIEAGLPTRD